MPVNNTLKPLLEALLAIQQSAPTLQKDSTNPHFQAKYVSLRGLHEAVLPLLNEHGLVWLTLPLSDGGTPVLTYQLIHVATGASIDGTMPLMLDRQNPQGQGSAITYARRYSLMALLGLVADEDDDDGNAASAKPAARVNSNPVTTTTTTTATNKDADRPPNPVIPRDRARAILAKAVEVNLAEITASGTPKYHPVFKALLASHTDASGKQITAITKLNVDDAEEVEKFLAAETAQLEEAAAQKAEEK